MNGLFLKILSGSFKTLLLSNNNEKYHIINIINAGKNKIKSILYLKHNAPKTYVKITNDVTMQINNFSSE